MSEPENRSFKEIFEETGNRKVDGLTVAELAGLLRDYSKYEKLSARDPVSSPVLKPVCRPVPAKPARRKFDEILIGKYLMTVAAAILCLLAAAIFAANFWPVLPGQAKYGILLSVGCSLWVLGYVKTGTSNIRPFWLGVAGLGSGVVFLDMILGHSEWGLYPVLFVGILCLVWTGACFWMARIKSAWLFYLIAYAGGLITFELSRNVIGSFGDELLACLVAVIILIMGAWARRDKKHWALALLWLLGCWAMGTGLVNIPYAAPDYIATEETFRFAARSWTHVYPYFCAVLACGSVWFVCKAVPETRKHEYLRPVLIAILSFSNAFFVQAMCGDLFNYEYSGNILAAGILISGIFISKQGYILGVSVPVMMLISGDGSWGYILIMSCLAAAACALSLKYKHEFDRAGLFLAWLAAARIVVRNANLVHGTDPSPACAPAFLGAWLILITGLAVWAWFRNRKHDWSAGALSYLVILTAALYSFLIPAGIYNWPDWILTCLCAVAFSAFRRVYLSGRETMAPGHGPAAWALCLVFSAVSVGALSLDCLLFDFFDEGHGFIEPFALTVSLFLIAGMDVYGMVKSRKPLQGILSCLAANWCMLLSVRIWSPGARVLASAMGILISACFVAAGFRLDKKPARQAGLGCALLYALKLGLYDMSFGSGLGVSIGFLISGLGCFGISLLYNKLGKVLGDGHDGKEE